jgi:hypothetical protein
LRKRAIVDDLATQQRDAVCAEDTDAGRTAHGERSYRLLYLVDGRRAADARLVGQQTLVDILDGVAAPAHGFTIWIHFVAMFVAAKQKAARRSRGFTCR